MAGVVARGGCGRPAPATRLPPLHSAGAPVVQRPRRHCSRLGACSSYDVVSILKKSRQEITDCEIKITSQRANSDPKVFTDIQLHFIVSGHNLKEKQVERAIKLSAEKYCSASIMLGATANITHDFEIINVD